MSYQKAESNLRCAALHRKLKLYERACQTNGPLSIDHPHKSSKFDLNTDCFVEKGYTVSNVLAFGGYGTLLSATTNLGESVVIKIDVSVREKEMAILAAAKHIGPRVIDWFTCDITEGGFTIPTNVLVMESFDMDMVEYHYGKGGVVTADNVGLVISLLEKQIDASMVHGDFSLRNMLVRIDPESGALQQVVLTDFATAKIVPGARKWFIYDWLHMYEVRDVFNRDARDRLEEFFEQRLGFRKGLMVHKWLDAETGQYVTKEPEN